MRCLVYLSPNALSYLFAHLLSTSGLPGLLPTLEHISVRIPAYLGHE